MLVVTVILLWLAATVRHAVTPVEERAGRRPERDLHEVIR